MSSAFYQITFATSTGSSDGKESACSWGDLGSIPGVWKIPWRRAWQSTPVVLPGESPWTEEPGGLQSMGSQRDGHDRASFTPLAVFAATCICRSPMPSVHRMLTNAHGGMLPTCPAITAESDGFRGRVPSILVLPVPLSDGGGRQGPDLGTDSLGERRPWTSS